MARLRSCVPLACVFVCDGRGGPRNQVRPPDKGVFPLDHFHECQGRKREYMDCLKRNNGSARECADISRKYLECRMETYAWR